MKTTLPTFAPKATLTYSDGYRVMVKSYGPAPDGYRWLKVGEKRREGDIYAEGYGKNWKSSLLTTEEISPTAWPVARPITPEPKKAPMPTHTPKTLKYEIVERHNGLVAAKITEQSHRKSKFGKSNDTFGKLSSVDCPQNRIGDYLDKFFVRGGSESRDNDLMLFTDAQFAEFEKEVAAYNAHFAKPAILKTVFFKYNGGSIRGYRKVQVVKEDSTYIEGYDADKGEYRKYLKSKIVGPVDTVKA